MSAMRCSIAQPAIGLASGFILASASAVAFCSLETASDLKVVDLSGLINGLAEFCCIDEDMIGMALVVGTVAATFFFGVAVTTLVGSPLSIGMGAALCGTYALFKLKLIKLGLGVIREFLAKISERSSAKQSSDAANRVYVEPTSYSPVAADDNDGEKVVPETTSSSDIDYSFARGASPKSVDQS